MTAVSTAGVAGFIAGMSQCGVVCQQVGTVVVFVVEACDGPLAGQRVQTGVGVEELAMWPAAPPHWVHLPATVTLTPTNMDINGTQPGWVRHSRQAAAWGDAAEPAQAWLSHIRGVLTQASQ